MAKQDDGKNKGVKPPKVSEPKPRLVKEVPEGYVPEVRDGKTVYVKRTETKGDTIPVKPRPITKVPTGKPKKPIRPQPSSTPPTENIDVVYLEESTPETPVKQGGQYLRSDLKQEFPSGLAKGYKQFQVPDLTTGGGYTKQKTVIVDEQGMPVQFDFQKNQYVRTGEPNIYQTIPAQADTPILQKPLDENQAPTIYGNEPTRLRTPQYNAPKLEVPKVNPNSPIKMEGFNNLESESVNESDAEFLEKQNKKISELRNDTTSMPKFNKGGLVGKVKGYAEGTGYKGVTAKKAADTAGKGLGAFGSSYYAMQQPSTEGEMGRNIGMQAVGQMGPVGGAISGITAIADQASKPLRERSERLDPQTGEILDEKKALRNARIGIAFDPTQRLKYEGGLTDVTGKKYLESLNKEYKKDLAAVKEANVKSKQQQALAAREAGEENPSYYEPYNLANARVGKDRRLEFADGTTFDPNMPTYAKGGTIKGPGTGTSDSILSKVSKDGIPAGSFITPAKNNGLAKQIRKKVLGDNPDKVAKFEKGGEMEDDADVAVSNGEHLFTPKEKQKIVSYLGKEILEQLAPEAEEDSDEMAKGGLTRNKAREILHDKSVHGKPLTDKQRKFMGAVASGYVEGYEKGGSVKAPKVMGYANGGPVKGTKVGNATWDGKNWIANDGSKYTEEAGKKFTDMYNKQVSESKRKETEAKSTELSVYKRKLSEAEKSGDSKQVESLRKKISEISGEKPAESKQAKESDPTATPKTTGGVKAPKVGSAKKTEPEKMEPIAVTKVQEDIVTPDVTAKITEQQDVVSQPDTKKEGQKKGVLGTIAGVDPTMFVGPLQAQMGMKMLKGEKRPVFKGELDPRYNKAVERAQYQAQFGLTPEQRFMAEQDIQKSLNDALAQGRSMSGGSGVQAYNLNRAAANEAWRNKLGLKQADLGARMEKQQYADRMVAERAAIIERNRRQAFEDAMMGFQQRQGAGAQLVGAGLANTIGAYRFNKDLQAQKERNNLDWSRNYGA